MPYYIEARFHTTPLDRRIGSVDAWKRLSDYGYDSKTEIVADITQLRKDDPTDEMQYRISGFVSIAHPDEFDDREWGSHQ